MNDRNVNPKVTYLIGEKKKKTVNFSWVKLLAGEKNKSPLKNWSLFTA